MIKNLHHLFLLFLLIIGCSNNKERIGKMNRLAESQSPYLLQHKNNPVDWYPWGNEAFQKAEKENKPIFLSIGYSTCHWCHVMEHESFEDEEVAKLMNDNFISIKVDREEMPEIDHLYMSVCQAMTGRGGWPLTIVMSPKKEPFFAGTYFPKTGRGNQPGMMELIPSLMNAWNNKQDDIQKTIKQVNEYLISSNKTASGKSLEKDVIHNAYENFVERYDNENGGFGSAPKFPSPHNLIFLLRYYKSYGEKTALNMVTKTLEKMRLGGIFDHIGFGFHRYSTDQNWFLPHFEKMLYDQAMISMAYLEGFEATKNKKYADVVEEVFAYVLRDMTNEEGAFLSAEDADSEGEEGKFYIWKYEEIINILGIKKGEEFCEIFGIKKDGNFLDEATGQLMPDNIPYLKNEIETFVQINELNKNELEKTLEEHRNKLFKIRKKRIHPLKDDKVLTDWNGLMIAAMAKGGRVLNNQKYINAAINSADFILNNLMDSRGRLLKRYRVNSAGLQPHIDDYSFFIWGLLELYQATFDTRFLASALNFSEIMVEDFLDKKNGGFFIGPNNGEKLIVRAKDSYDGAIPSGNAVAALNCIRLSKLTGDSKWEEIAFETFKAFSSKVYQTPSAHSFMLSAYMFGLESPKEVVIVAEKNDDRVKNKIIELRNEYNPHTVFIFKSMKESSELDLLAPWTKTHHTIDSEITYFICENFACKMPTIDIKTAVNNLD